jgi:hypothetical protein
VKPCSRCTDHDRLSGAAAPLIHSDYRNNRVVVSSDAFAHAASKAVRTKFVVLFIAVCASRAVTRSLRALQKRTSRSWRAGGLRLAEDGTTC